MKCRNCNKTISRPKKKYCDEFCGNELRAKHQEEYKKHRMTTCQECGITETESRAKYGLDLFAHHIDGDIRVNCKENLLTLCKKCHGVAHSNPLKEDRGFYTPRSYRFSEEVHQEIKEMAKEFGSQNLAMRELLRVYKIRKLYEENIEI
jgi:hypothetical protein